MTDTKTTPTDTDHPHSIFGASGAKRWRRCPGSANAIERAKAKKLIPEKTETKASKEGTAAHDWAYKVLTDQCGMEEVPEGFRNHLEGYIKLCQTIEADAKKLGGTAYHETTVPLFFRPEDVSTLDFAAVTEDKIVFVDLKYGAGVWVEARDNDQLVIYFLSLLAQLEKEGKTFDDDTEVVLSIYQPRHFKFDGMPNGWKTTVRELKDIGIDIEDDYKTAVNAIGKDSELCASEDACMFCDIKGICSTRGKTSFGNLPPQINPLTDFDIEATPKDITPENLTSEQVKWICENSRGIKKFCDDVIKNEYARIEDGGELRGMKLVEGSLGNRAWVDSKAAETFLRSHLSVDQRYQPRKLISAPQAIALLKHDLDELSTIAKVKIGLADEETMEKSKTKSLIHRPPGKPKLVTIDDPAEALQFKTPAGEFDVEHAESDGLDELF